MILKLFQNYLTSERRYSAHTVRAYTSDLRQYQAYLIDVYDTNDMLLATSQMVRSYIIALVQEELDPKSIRRKRSVLNSFYNFALKQGRCKINPVETIVIPKAKKKLPGYLREGELAKLEEHLPAIDDLQTGRDHVIIALLYSTGIRRSELMQLHLSDLHLANRTLRVLGKRKKERIVPLTNYISKKLQAYLVHRASSNPDSPHLFLTNQGKPLYPKFVYNLVRRYMRAITAAENMGPHALRHTFATLMLDQGADINAIKELLGHADLNATQIYTHTSIEKLKQAYVNAHPRAGNATG